MVISGGSRDTRRCFKIKTLEQVCRGGDRGGGNENHKCKTQRNGGVLRLQRQ